MPVFGLLGAWAVLGERPTSFLLLGGAAILVGVILTNSAPRPSPSPVPRRPVPTTAYPASVAHPIEGGKR